MILFILGLIFLLYAFRWVRELKQVPNISEKYVYITGCDTGFGNLLAKHLDILGFCVIAGCYTEKGEDELNKACSTRLSTVQLDVTDNNSISKATDFIKTLVVFGRISIIGGPYCISKHGVEAFNDSLRINMAQFGVKVLCIEPGCFKTGVTDIDVILNNVQKLWDRLPQDVKDDYGSIFLKNKFVKMLDGDLMKVVSCMEHAVAAVHPRTRYSPGWDARLFWLLLSYLPTCIADAIILKNISKPKASVYKPFLCCSELLYKAGYSNVLLTM
uniref:Uncharacterized protein n=1 Tax=Electrophorus electricus TaxID=8005 RepID=A0A4W4GV64_ELEEL